MRVPPQVRLVARGAPGCESHARRTLGIRMTLLTTEGLFWHCGAHTAKPESASGRRFLITKICCFLWHVGNSARSAGAGATRGRRLFTTRVAEQPVAVWDHTVKLESAACGRCLNTKTCFRRQVGRGVTPSPHLRPGSCSHVWIASFEPHTVYAAGHAPDLESLGAIRPLQPACGAPTPPPSLPPATLRSQTYFQEQCA